MRDGGQWTLVLHAMFVMFFGGGLDGFGRQGSCRRGEKVGDGCWSHFCVYIGSLRFVEYGCLERPSQHRICRSHEVLLQLILAL